MKTCISGKDESKPSKKTNPSQIDNVEIKFNDMTDARPIVSYLNKRIYCRKVGDFATQKLNRSNPYLQRDDRIRTPSGEN